MKSSLVRIGGLLALLGGVAGLLGFLVLPFGMNPIYLRMYPGIQLIQSYMRRAGATAFSSYGGQIDYKTYIPFLISYISMWAIPVIFALLALLALFLLFRRRIGRALPLFCLVLSLLAVIGLFLAFVEYADNGGNLLYFMFSHNSLFTPIIGIGWWVCLGGTLCAFVASIFAFRGRQRASF